MPQISFLKQKSLFTYLRFRLKKCLQLPTTSKIYIKISTSTTAVSSSIHCTIWSLRMEDMQLNFFFQLMFVCLFLGLSDLIRFAFFVTYITRSYLLLLSNYFC